MSDFLADLANRSYGDPSPAGTPGAIRPRLPSVFEPAPPGPSGEAALDVEEVEVDFGGRRRLHRGPLRVQHSVEVVPVRDVSTSAEDVHDGPLRSGVGKAVAPPESSETVQPPEQRTRRASRTLAPTEAVAAQSAVATMPVVQHPPFRSVPVAGTLSPAPAPDPEPKRDHTSEQRRESSAPPPVVQVTIGRVEVRAVLPTTPPPRSPTPPVQPRSLALTDYLNGRKGQPGGQA